MILRSITVDGIACFADRFNITDLSDGLNIIYGPNGSGKSTLMTAIARALFDSHRVGGARIKELVPWGRKLSPTVELQFEHGGTGYRIEKKFITEAASTLSRLEDGRYVSLARGSDADSMIREMMQATASSRGASDVNNWGISQILFAPQHEIALPELAGNIAQRIRQSFTDQVMGDEGSRLATCIAEEYKSVFTPAGKYKTGKSAPPLIDMQAKRDSLLEQRDELAQLLDTYDQCSSDIVSLDDTIKSYTQQLDSIESQRKQATEVADRYRDLIRRRDQETANAKAVEEQYLSLQRRIEQLAKERNEAAQGEKRIAQLEQQSQQNDTELQQRTEAYKECSAALIEAEKQKIEIDQLSSKADAAARLTEQTQRIERLARDLERIEAATQERDAARRQRSETVVPSADEMRAIRAAIRDYDKALLQLDSAMLHVKILPETALSIDMRQGEISDDRQNDSSGDIHLSGSPSIEFTIDGVGSFEVTGPVASVDQLRSECTRLDKKIAELTEPYGTRDSEQLEQLHQQGIELDRRIEESENSVRERLDGREIDSIRTELSRAKQITEEIQRSYPQWIEAEVSAEALREEAETARRQWETAVADARRKATEAQKELQSAETQQKILAERLESERRQAAQAELRIQSLTDDGMDDDARQKKLDETAIDFRAARASLEQANKAIDQIDGDPMELAETFGRQADQLRKQIERAKNEQSEKRGRLQTIADSSPYGELAEVAERIESLEREIATETKRCLAIRMLHETVTSNMRKISNLVVGPIQQRSQKILRRIIGTRLGSLQLDDNFRPEGLVQPHIEDTINVGQISGGEREQVEFAIRLALAQILTESDTTGRQTMMLDDVLTMSDTARFARILKLLEESAEKMQILIFTCHPERYGGLENSRMFDIEGLKRNSTDATNMKID